MRVLVDRLWPRGLTKTAARIDLWAKGIAPSSALRTWYRHDPEKFSEFSERYRRELSQKTDAFRELLHLKEEHGRLTLLTATRDLKLSHALVLRGEMERI